MRSLEERGELGAPHGRLVLATLIIQDLAIVPMILLVPLLAEQNVMINPERPVVMYESMNIDLDRLDIQALALETAEACAGRRLTPVFRPREEGNP